MTRPLPFVSAILLLSFAAAPTALGQGYDRIRLESGTENGRIQRMTAQEITVNKGTSTKVIPVNEIVDIRFDREPRELAQARIHLAGGAYQNALGELEKIDAKDIRRAEIAQDVEFYTAKAKASLAIETGTQLREAGNAMNEFANSHPQNYHYYAAVETMGDLLMAMQLHTQAQAQYAKLDDAKWPDYQIKAAVLQGRALAAAGEHTKAIQQFDQALAIEPVPPQAKTHRLEAQLAKAVSLAETGNAEVGTKIAYEVIQQASPEDSLLHARAYNALGRCHDKQGDQKEALLAYLHVDLLYSNHAEAHAEALHYLAPLWEAIGRSDEARKARQLLQTRYAESRWATP